MNNRENETLIISEVCLFYIISGYERKSDKKRLKRSFFEIKKNCYQAKPAQRNGNVEDDKLSKYEHENNNDLNKAKVFTFDKLVRVNKDTFKKYTISVNYVDVSDEVRKIKRAIVEDILKKS